MAVVMIAMLVVVTMVVTMVMIVAVMVSVMLVRGVIVLRMIMRIVGMRVAGIGTAFGIERRFDLDQARVQPSQHRLDHMIAADAQSSCRDLGRQVPIAEVPGEADQMLRIAPPDFQQRLGRGHHLDQPPIFEHQRIPAAQGDRLFQIEQEFQPTRTLHRHPPTVAIVKVEHNTIGRRLAPAMLSPNLYGPDHRKMSRDACRREAPAPFMDGVPSRNDGSRIIAHQAVV
jgi:hypothetical protein